jgi:hypothetical protein
MIAGRMAVTAVAGLTGCGRRAYPAVRELLNRGGQHVGVRGRGAAEGHRERSEHSGCPDSSGREPPCLLLALLCVQCGDPRVGQSASRGGALAERLQRHGLPG